MPKLYTKTGDNGTTSLYDGSIVSKTHDIINILGDIDELSSHIGLLCSYLTNHVYSELTSNLRFVQLNLIDISSILATIDTTNRKLPEITQKNITFIEKEIDEICKQLPSLTEFLITGVSKEDAQSNVCRSVTRRCERNLYVLKNNTKFASLITKDILIYFNRLSDYFFSISRWLCPKEIKVSDIRSSYSL